MQQTKLTLSGKPFDIHERLLLFACDIVRVTQFLHTRGPIGRRLSYQILDAGTSVGSNVEEADGASSHKDFIAKKDVLRLPPPPAMHACETVCAGGGKDGGTKKAAAAPPENPALEAMNRAFLLQAEQVNSYRARRDASLDDLEDD